ncbi:hypothetical protein BCR34DRAFT_583135 [Clohesyomyces aquaticus]|uniref:Uncharacterized protein n=1 Tax=Clohesyomyces aquaticus TaxID=1231657 RepID=A0A1Y2A6P3_9PLEO|nr:hypothetical protein BCR34DRAFT_583135 [Clohesyomyces aquaticus]
MPAAWPNALQPQPAFPATFNTGAGSDRRFLFGVVAVGVSTRAACLTIFSMCAALWIAQCPQAGPPLVSKASSPGCTVYRVLHSPSSPTSSLSHAHAHLLTPNPVRNRLVPNDDHQTRAAYVVDIETGLWLQEHDDVVFNTEHKDASPFG